VSPQVHNFPGPVTGRDVAQWQHRGAIALVELTRRTLVADLPSLVWTIKSSRCIGSVPVLVRGKAREETFAMWVRALELVDLIETSTGRYATGVYRTESGARVTVEIRCEIEG